MQEAFPTAFLAHTVPARDSSVAQLVQLGVSPTAGSLQSIPATRIRWGWAPRHCEGAHIEYCVRVWCWIERPRGRDWVCVWCWAGSRGGGGGAGENGLKVGGRGRLRLIQCVHRAFRNGGASADVSRRRGRRLQGWPPLECSVRSDELPMSMQMRMCVVM